MLCQCRGQRDAIEKKTLDQSGIKAPAATVAKTPPPDPRSENTPTQDTSTDTREQNNTISSSESSPPPQSSQPIDPPAPEVKETIDHTNQKVTEPTESVVSEQVNESKEANEKTEEEQQKPNSTTQSTESGSSKSKLLGASLLGGSIEDLLEETRKEMGEVKSEPKPLSLEVVQNIWKEYRESIESPSTQATLEKVIIAQEADAIQVTVPSNVSKEEISQETDLYQKLRNAFNNPQLNIILKVDRSQFPDLAENENTRMYTMKEKYDYLVNKNSELNNLVETLKLKIDQD